MIFFAGAGWLAFAKDAEPISHKPHHVQFPPGSPTFFICGEQDDENSLISSLCDKKSEYFHFSLLFALLPFFFREIQLMLYEWGIAGLLWYCVNCVRLYHAGGLKKSCLKNLARLSSALQNVLWHVSPKHALLLPSYMWERASHILWNRSGASGAEMRRRVRRCAQCGKGIADLQKQNGKLKRCRQCKRVWYCGMQCHRAHWAVHRTACEAEDAPGSPGGAVGSAEDAPERPGSAVEGSVLDPLSRRRWHP